MLEEARCNFMEDFTPELYREIREIIIELILATDMAKHFKILGRFGSKFTNTIPQELKSSEKLDIFRMMIKCADLGHGAKEIDLHTK